MIRSLELKQFRSYDSASFVFGPSINVISGPNGSGKTNILEAVHVLLRGSPFRSVTSDDMRRYGTTWWRIDTTVDGHERSVSYDLSRSGLKKRFRIGENDKSRLLAAQYYPVVTFDPGDLRLLQGSPSRRRDFIDDYIAQLNPTYKAITQRYERALRQRNNLLKEPNVGEDNLFVWELTLADLGSRITVERSRLIHELNARLSGVYARVATAAHDTITMSYVSRIVGDGVEVSDGQQIQQRILSHLHAARARDIVVGHTSVGPHRDDIAFFINGHDAGAAASRGETRTIVLSLKFLEIDHIMRQTEKTPLLLLDDVFSELDASRRDALLRATSNCQIFITTTDADIMATAKQMYANVKHIRL